MRGARWFLILTLAAACARPSGGQAEGVEDEPPMAAAEQDRGKQLCDAYVARVCACADREASLREQCDLARSQPEALRLHLALLGGKEGALNTRERRVTEENARKVIAACVKADGALAPDRCPRP